MSRRLVLVLGVAALAVLAGCSGGGTGDNTDTTTVIEGTTAGPDGSTTQATNDEKAKAVGASGDGGGPQYTHFDFEEGASYEYDVVMSGTDGTFRWEVTDVSDDRVTVHTDYLVGGVVFEDTVTGTRATLEAELEATPAGPFMTLGVFHPFYDHYGGHDLRVGNSWSASVSSRSATYEVTGTDAYAGVDCYGTEVRIDGSLRHEGCVSPDLGLLVHSVVYDQTGSRSVVMTLSAYSSD